MIDTENKCHLWVSLVDFGNKISLVMVEYFYALLPKGVWLT
ncbi:hypothetical protein Q4493_01820 [Colwellia sp. 1_MG-2023]|nr:hypothetical protein [Colwellia sp. 1_MG-2023]MDO6444503.1 hypothetical protein [Colwellia sp. 1_MG-2023]